MFSPGLAIWNEVMWGPLRKLSSTDLIPNSVLGDGPCVLPVLPNAEIIIFFLSVWLSSLGSASGNVAEAFPLLCVAAWGGSEVSEKPTVQK